MDASGRQIHPQLGCGARVRLVNSMSDAVGAGARDNPARRRRAVVAGGAKLRQVQSFIERGEDFARCLR